MPVFTVPSFHPWRPPVVLVPVHPAGPTLDWATDITVFFLVLAGVLMLGWLSRGRYGDPR